MSLAEDLVAAAEEEIERAMDLGWPQLRKLTPYGDTYDGFTPEGREVCFERTYLWEGETGGDIRLEVTVYEPRAYEDGVKLTRSIPRENLGSTA